MNKPTVIQPKRHISQKVPKHGGPSPEEAILKAVNAAEGLMEMYQGWAVDDLADLWQSFRDIEMQENSETRITEMYNISHEIRGHGGTFGFALISSISDSLCKFLDGATSLSKIEQDVIRIHILAMKAVFSQGLKGDQSEFSSQLSELLKALCNKTILRAGKGTRPVAQ